MITRKSKEKPLHSAYNNIKFILLEVWRSDKVLGLYLVLETCCGVLAPFFGIYLPKLVIDMITGHASQQQMILSLGGFTILMATVGALNGFTSAGKYMRYNDIRQNYIIKLFMKSLSCDYNLVESSEGQTRYQKALSNTANGDGSGVNMLMQHFMGLVVTVLSFVLYASILSMLNPIIVILLIGTALISLFWNKYMLSLREKYVTPMAIIDKKLDYIENAMADYKAGKDVRIYKMKPFFIKLRDIALNDRLKVDSKILTMRFSIYAIGALTTLLRDGAAYIYLIYQVSAGNITIGEFVLFFGAIAGFADMVSRVITDFTNLNWASIYINSMRDFLEQTDVPTPNPTVTIPTGVPGIEFRNVCFSYDKDGEKILNDFSLIIEPGEKIALVGVNGAGKTTLVKLLCGFYTPDSGSILINGVDISKTKKEELFTLFSAVFQDIMILPYTVAENISLQLKENTDRERVIRCLESAGLLEYIEKNRGIDAPMLKIVEEDGLMLSGGQQQRLLLARALYKDASILILDEPTAALDPIAESEVYNNYHNFSNNKTSIFISHRLASTRFCNRIVFLSNGKPEEIGSHDELIKNNGKYAKMFEIQSHYYQDGMEGGVQYV